MMVTYLKSLLALCIWLAAYPSWLAGANPVAGSEIASSKAVVLNSNSQCQHSAEILNGAPKGFVLQPNAAEVVPVKAFSTQGFGLSYGGTEVVVRYHDFVQRNDPAAPVNMREYKVFASNHQLRERTVTFMWRDAEHTTIPVQSFQIHLKAQQADVVCTNFGNYPNVHPQPFWGAVQIDD